MMYYKALMVALVGTFTTSLIGLITPESLSAWLQLGTMIGVVTLGIISKLNLSVTNKIHTLSNGKMEAQLRISYLYAKQVRELTEATKDVAAIKTALQVELEAKRLYDEHTAKQIIVDQKL